MTTSIPSNDYLPLAFSLEEVAAISEAINRSIYYRVDITDNEITVWPIAYIAGYDPIKITVERFIPTNSRIYKIEVVHEDPLDEDIPKEYFTARWTIPFEHVIDKVLHFYDEVYTYWKSPLHSLYK